MGFIERLRQEKEVRKRQATAEKELKQRIEAETRSAVQRRNIEQEKNLRQSLNQAIRFHKESGLPSLIKGLCDLIDGQVWGNVNESSSLHGLEDLPYGNCYYVSGYGQNSESYLRSNQTVRESVVCEIIWDTTTRYHSKIKYFSIETCLDGTINFRGGWLGSSKITKEQWKKDKGSLESALEKAYYHPRQRNHELPGVSYSQPGGYGGWCLPGNALISTPGGSRSIKSLKIGDYVWTVDKFGKKTKVRIIQKCRKVVPKNHKIVHLTLKDGRTVFVSAYHPTIEGKPVVSLKKGQVFNDSFVLSVSLIPYYDKYTYDILPAGETGGYWANDIPLGSTLFHKFETSSLVLMQKPNQVIGCFDRII